MRRASAGVAVLAAVLVRAPAGAGDLLVELQVQGNPSVIAGLDRPGGVAMSADGAHLYVAASLGASVVAFARNAATGALSAVDTETDGVGGVDGLAGVYGIAVSPDGAHVYVAAPSDDAVAVFSRNAATGVLTFVEAHIDGVGGLDCLAGAINVAMSPDGAHVYATAFNDERVCVFSRSAATGALMFVQAATAAGLAGADGIAVAPDGAHVYATGFFNQSVVALSRNAATGMLTYVQTYTTSNFNASGVTVSADGAHVYAISEGYGAIDVFSRNAGTGELTLVQTVQDTFGIRDYGAPRGLTLSPDGAQAYIPVFSGDALLTYTRNATTGALTFLDEELDGISAAGLDAPNAAAVVSPDGTHVYASGLASDAVAAFARNGATGALTFLDATFGTSGLAAPEVPVFSPDGAHVYVPDSASSAVLVFGRDAGSGALTWVETERDGAGVDGLDTARSAAVSPDGAHVYVAGQGDDAVVAFERNAATGALTLVEVERDGVGGVSGLAGVNAVVVSPDGQHVYAHGGGPDVVAFSRDPGTGALTFVQGGAGGGGFVPSGLTMAPDGAYVYTATSGGLTDLRTFARNATTGELALVDTAQLLGIVWSLAASPDGTHVYAASIEPDAVVALARNGMTGALTLQERVYDDDQRGLDGALSVAVSPDGTRIYAASNRDSAVAMLGREPGTGHMIYRLAAFEGSGGFTGLTGVDQVAVSPDGRHLYAARDSPSTAASIAIFGFSSACPTAPLPLCRSAASTLTLLRDKPDPNRRTLKYRWSRGDETLTSDLGDPVTGSTVYALCVYDQSGGGDTLVMDAHAPHAGFCPGVQCWRETSTGLLYVPGTGAPDGLMSALLVTGNDGAAKARVGGRGEALSLPALPLVAPVTVQLVTSDGECWGQTYASGDILRNEPISGTAAGIFKARSP